MTAVFHGGRLDAVVFKYGGSREEWLDLSTGINPNAFPIPEVNVASWQRLPDEAAQTNLLTTARNYYSVPEQAGLVGGNGTQAILQILPFIMVPGKVAIVSPTYEEHRHSWEAAGREVLAPGDLNEAAHAAEIVVVVNPNNPTAVTYQPAQLMDVANKLNEKSGFLIVDEAFGDVMPELSVVPQLLDNMIVLRSFGKFFGLAGLRLGFAISNQSIAGKLSARLGPWNVSGPALEIGAAAFSDTNWVINTRTQIKQNSEDQVEVIKACGLELIGSAGLFMEFEHPHALRLYEALCHKHILVRPFAERPTRLRLGLCKNMEELERLAWVLKENV